MRRLIKWLFLVPVLLVAALVALVLSKDAIAKAAVEQQIRAQTRMEVKIGKFSLGLLSPVAKLENVVLANPAEFGGTPFLNLAEAYVEFDRRALLRRELRLKLVRLKVAELTVVRNDLGQTNLLVFAAAAARHDNGAAVGFQGIEVLNLSLQKVTYLDLGQPRNNRAYRVILQNQLHRDLKTAVEIHQIFVRIWERRNG